MALVRPSAKLNLNLHNHPTAPTVIHFALAPGPVWDKFEREQSRALTNPRRGMGVTSAMQEEAARVAWDFVFARLTAVDNFDVPGEGGAPKRLSWPVDKEAVRAEVQINVPIAEALYRKVFAAHKPSEESLGDLYDVEEEESSGN